MTNPDDETPDEQIEDPEIASGHRFGVPAKQEALEDEKHVPDEDAMPRGQWGPVSDYGEG